jgi:hypothetical protein
MSVNTEPSYDNVIVEAHTPGQDNWTTLPDTGGRTTTDPPAECAAGGFLLGLHPFLAHYLGGADCTAPGTSGDWNAFTSGEVPAGWQEVEVDLSAYAGQQVEVSISYVTDPASGGIGTFVDDTRVVVDGAVVDADGFEGATSSWTVAGSPSGSPPNAGNWQLSEQLVNIYAGTSTEDTLLLGFGLELLSSAEERADLVGRALAGLRPSTHVPSGAGRHGAPPRSAWPATRRGHRRRPRRERAVGVASIEPCGTAAMSSSERAARPAARPALPEPRGTFSPSSAAPATAP